MKTLLFTIDKKYILNANNMNSLHWAVKGNLVSYLRKTAAQEGLKHHSTETLEIAEKKLEAIYDEDDLVLQKRRFKTNLKKRKENKELTEKELNVLVDEEFADAVRLSAGINVPVLFDFYKIRGTVFPPSKRRLDPPNLYPTFKALIDGLTDASWWMDDDFTNLVEMSFRYGGTSGLKDSFKILMEISEIEDLDEYTLTAAPQQQKLL